MEKFNSFKKKAKEVAKIAGVASLSVVPPQQVENGGQIKPIEQTIETKTQEEKINDQNLDSNLYNEHVKKIKQENKKKYDFETFIPEEKLIETINNLKKDVIEQIPENINRHYNGRFSKYEKIKTHDHEILAVGSGDKFNAEDYIKLMAQTGDSLYFFEKPVISFEGYLLNYNIKLLKEEEVERKENELKQKYDSLKKEKSWKTEGMDYEQFSKYERRWLTEENSSKWQNKYNEYKDANNHPETREMHVGSTLYAFLRSGAYDNFIAQGGDKEKLLQKMLTDISNPKYYEYDSLAKDQTLKGKYHTERYEVAWMVTTWLEFEKRGITPEIYFGNKDEVDGQPITLEKLTEINKEQLEFTLDTTNTNKKIDSQLEKRSLPMNSESACEGTHSLHATIMYDIYKKDTTSLDSHLNLSKEMLQKTLGEYEEIRNNKSEENINKYITIVHNLSHELLGFTELPEDFNLDPELKKIVQNSVALMVELTTIIQNKEKMKVNDMSHILDILEHLPRCVLEK